MPSTTGRPALTPHRRRLLLFGLPLLAGAAVFVGVYFQPHKLFVDERVDEAAPAGITAGAQAGTGSPPSQTEPGSPGQPGRPADAPAVAGGPETMRPAAPAAPVIVASGTFRSLEHSTTGRTSVTQLPDGSRLLRFEDLVTSNGPDLRVYLSAGSSDANFGAEYGLDFVELGKLKGNLGNQNYVVPPGVDLAHYRNAVIWCARFSVGFGVATLG